MKVPDAGIRERIRDLGNFDQVFLTPKGGSPVLPGWPWQFDIYDNPPATRLSICNDQALERFRDGRD
jgi:hypothetical protein